jgi:hypothetical protein
MNLKGVKATQFVIVIYEYFPFAPTKSWLICFAHMHVHIFQFRF